MSYTIIDVERQTGISSRTLRFWAGKGLFPFTQLSEHGTRYFAQSDVEWEQWIGCLRSLDMSIEDIRRYLYLFSQGKDTVRERKDFSGIETWYVSNVENMELMFFHATSMPDKYKLKWY